MPLYRFLFLAPVEIVETGDFDRSVAAHSVDDGRVVPLGEREFREVRIVPPHAC